MSTVVESLVRCGNETVQGKKKFSIIIVTLGMTDTPVKFKIKDRFTKILEWFTIKDTIRRFLH